VQHHRGMAQRLTRDRAPVSAAAADFVVALHDCNALVIFRSHHRCAFTCGSAANHKHIEVHLFASHVNSSVGQSLHHVRAHAQPQCKTLLDEPSYTNRTPLFEGFADFYRYRTRRDIDMLLPRQNASDCATKPVTFAPSTCGCVARHPMVCNVRYTRGIDE